MSELYDFLIYHMYFFFSDYLLMQTYNELFNHSLLIDNFISRLFFLLTLSPWLQHSFFGLHIIPQVYE